MSLVPVVVVHGGAGAHALITHDAVARRAIEEGVKAAARAGHAALTASRPPPDTAGRPLPDTAGRPPAPAGTAALDAVEAAVRALEDNPIFNAGRGSCLTICGTIQMDASIMDGRTLRAGAVGCVENVPNPISLARIVLDKSDHVLFVGDGAKQFALEHGVPTVITEDLITDKARQRLRNFATFNPSVKVDFNEKTKTPLTPDPSKDGSHDTVGAVAMDAEGNVAYATSTGGINAKMPGRCGDSAIPGCGGYCDNGVGAVSTTGHGESFIRTNVARLAVFHLQQGKSIQEALDLSLSYTMDRVGGCGGAVGLSSVGDIGVSFNTEGMSWAAAKGDELRYGIYATDNFSETL